MARVPRPARTVLAARDRLAEHDHTGHPHQANQVVMRELVGRLAAHRSLPNPDWPALSASVDGDALREARAILADLDMTDWDITDLAGAYEHLIDKVGAWFTPPEIAQAMVRLSIGPQLDRLAAHPDPGNVLQVLAVDPSCGCGVFLVNAARLIAARYAQRLFGEASALTVSIVLPDVLAETIFGIDVDPTAVDLAKAALWFEINGEQPITFLDRNIIVGDTLAGPEVEPPHLRERRGGEPDRPLSETPALRPGSLPS